MPMTSGTCRLHQHDHLIMDLNGINLGLVREKQRQTERESVCVRETVAVCSCRLAPWVTSLMCFPSAMVEVNVAKNKKSAPRHQRL